MSDDGQLDRQRLREYMKLAGLRQTDVARVAGVSQPYISAMCDGTRRVTPAVLAAAEGLAIERAGALLVKLGARLGVAAG